MGAKCPPGANAASARSRGSRARWAACGGPTTAAPALASGADSAACARVVSPPNERERHEPDHPAGSDSGPRSTTSDAARVALDRRRRRVGRGGFVALNWPIGDLSDRPAVWLGSTAYAAVDEARRRPMASRRRAMRLRAAGRLEVSSGPSALSAWRRGQGGSKRGAAMALRSSRVEHARTAGHVSHDAQVRIDKRVERILARRETARRAAHTAAARAKEPDDRGTRGQA
jgi:hypothetical protein